jgi:spoIIIJ-associated protein
VTSDRLIYEVLQEATSGFLGIGAKPAIIRAQIQVHEDIDEEFKQAEKAGIEEALLVGKKESVKKSPAKKEPVKKETAKTAIKEAVNKEKEAVKKEADKKLAVKTEEEKKGPEKKAVSDEKDQTIITSDEIEKRAAAAAARARSEGRPEIPVRQEKREYSRKDRGRGHDRFKRHEDRERVSFEEVQAHEPSKPKPERVVQPISEELALELQNTAKAFLQSVFEAMKIEAEITTSYDQKEGSLSCVFAGEEMGILIGKRGQTLDSLQYLTSLVVNKKTEEYIRVKLDTEDYRARRTDTLSNLARNIAYRVKKTHRPVALEPMNPYERRIIHSSLQGNRFVETYSEGEEPYRHVVVTPKR